MSFRNGTLALALSLLVVLPAVKPQPVGAATEAKPNIVFIMGDEIGWSNIGVYNQGLMAGKTPNLDRLANEGLRFTDYYAESTSTAGRANFLTGQLPLRSGLFSSVPIGSFQGIPDQAITLATALRAQGYSTGQFGENAFGDRNLYLPTLHGFDEFFGYLYPLSVFEANYPASLKDAIGPRNVVHSWATDVDDSNDQPRWGHIGRQKVEDAGALDAKRMETIDDEIVSQSVQFMDKCKKEEKPFFVWLNPSRMHAVTHLSAKYEAMRSAENGWGVEEAGMAQLDDMVGTVMKYLKDGGMEQNTVLVFASDSGPKPSAWPDGGQTPFAGGAGSTLEGGFRAPCIVRWPGKVPAGKVENGIMSGLDWFPTFVSVAGDANIKDELLQGKPVGARNYKIHLDGYNQLDFLTAKAPSNRHEVCYFNRGSLEAMRFDDYKYRFNREKTSLTNLRLDPYERSSAGHDSSQNYPNWLRRESWHFSLVQPMLVKFAQSVAEYPPMQKLPGLSADELRTRILEKSSNLTVE